MNGVNRVLGQNNRRIISRESQKEAEEMRLIVLGQVVDQDLGIEGGHDPACLKRFTAAAFTAAFISATLRAEPGLRAKLAATLAKVPVLAVREERVM